MNFFPQPCAAPSESARLGAEQGHAKSAPAPRFTFDSHPRESTRKRVPQLRGASRERGSSLPLIPFPRNPLIPRRLPAAFSLTEVVIAMGVAAVAFTSIIALFPLGLNMSKESYEATQAAVIAQSIMADLSDQGSADSGKLIQKTGINDTNANNYITIPMTASSGGTDRYIYLAYDQQIRTDSSNSPVMLRPCTNSVSLNGPNEPEWFKTNAPAGAIFLVKVSLKHSFRKSQNDTSNPQRVDITIESPASAPATNRVQYVFSGAIPPS